MHLHGSTKIKVDLRKSDALWRFKGRFRVRFHEYKGLKRVLSIIIVRKSGGRDEWKSKETENEEEEEEERGLILILPLRTAHPLAGFSWLVSCSADRPFIKNAYNTYARKIDNVSRLEQEWRKVGPCLWHGRWMYEPKPCTFYRAARTLCIIRSLLQAYANLVHADHRIHCDERIETLKCKIV